MSFNRDNVSGCPCKGCTDRYPACSDHCRKEEFIRWRENLEKRKKAEREYRQGNNTMSEDKKKAMWRSKRYSRQVRYLRDNKE